MTRREQILKLCEFNGKDFNKKHPGDWTPYSFEEMARVANNKQKSIITALLEENEKLRGALKHTEEFCLCERFKTNGFDYGETHRYMGAPKTGSRWLTPRVVATQALASSPLDELLGEPQKEET